MARTIHVPDDEEGDETLKRLIPHLHAIAEGKMDDKRSR